VRLALLLLLALLAAACGGGGEATPTEPPAPATEPETTTEEAPPPATEATTTAEAAPKPLPGLPAWTAGYDAWTKLNDAPVPPRDSDPHLSTKEIYASTAAVEGLFPPGTVIVKEGVRPGKDFVGLIAAMRKLEGRNPEHNDWVFVEWERDAADAPFTLLAEGAVCESCHSGVAGQDYVFTNTR
jgi:hypothetical protein